MVGCLHPGFYFAVSRPVDAGKERRIYGWGGVGDVHLFPFVQGRPTMHDVHD